MSVLTVIYTLALFVLLIPGLAFKLPGFGKPIITALLHFLLFIVIYNIVIKQFVVIENFAPISKLKLIVDKGVRNGKFFNVNLEGSWSGDPIFLWKIDGVANRGCRNPNCGFYAPKNNSSTIISVDVISGSNVRSISKKVDIIQKKAFLSKKNNAKGFLKSIITPGQLAGVQSLYRPLSN